MADGRLEEKKV